MKKSLTRKRLALNKETLVHLQFVSGGSYDTENNQVPDDTYGTSGSGQGGSNLGSCTHCLNCPTNVSC